MPIADYSGFSFDPGHSNLAMHSHGSGEDTNGSGTEQRHHMHQALINGPAVAGRWISARNQVWQEAERSRPGNLPKLFHEGGRLSQFRRQAWDEDHLRCLAINGLLKAHEFEHRRWLPVWGPKQPPEPAGGGSESWQVIMEPPPAKDDPFSDTSSCNSRQGGAMHHQPLAVVDNSQRSCGRRRASRR